MFGVKNKKSKTLREAENSKSAISRLTNVSLRPRFRCWLDILRNVQRAMPAARAAFIPAVVLWGLWNTSLLLHQTQALRATTPLKLHYSSWKHHVERKGCCFNKWMTHFTYPAVTWSLRDKNPKDSRHQTNTENNRLEGGDPKKTWYPGDSFLLADWNGSNRKNNEGFLFMFTMFLDTCPRITSPCQDCPIWTEPFPIISESVFRKKNKHHNPPLQQSSNGWLVINFGGLCWWFLLVLYRNTRPLPDVPFAGPPSL